MLAEDIREKTLICKVDNQSLKAVMDRKGSTKVLALNAIGKQIYWLHQAGEFSLKPLGWKQASLTLILRES